MEVIVYEFIYIGYVRGIGIRGLYGESGRIIDVIGV